MTDIFKSFADLLGSLICHQLPSRSLAAGGMQLPVCARDTGIYLGMFISFTYIFLSGRRRSDRPPGIAAAIILCVFMLPMIVDGACSYLGVYETSNAARLLTGAFFGLPVPLFLIPAANFRLAGKNENSVLNGFHELAALTGAALLASFLTLEGLVPYAAISAVFISSFLFFIGRVAYTVVARTFRMKTLYGFMFSAGITGCVLAALYLVSSLVLQPMRAVFAG